MTQRLLLLIVLACPFHLSYASEIGLSSTLAVPRLLLSTIDTCPDVTLKPVLDLACGPGHAQATFLVTGGSGDYHFQWSNGSVDSLLNHLDPGQYSVTVSDGGCETYGAVDIHFDYKALLLDQHEYGSRDNDPLAAIAASPDGAFFYAAGWTNNSSFDVDTLRGADDVWLVKTDKTGQKIWGKTYGGTSSDIVSDVAVLPNGTVVVVGMSYSHDGDFLDTLVGRYAFVLKISPDGQLLQSLKVPPIFEGQYVSRVVAAADGSILIGGTDRTQFPTGPSISHPWFARLNADNSWAWIRQYFGANIIYFRDLVGDKVQGGCVFNFEFTGSLTPQPVRMAKLDENGDIVWQNGASALNTGPLAQMADGSFLAVKSISQNNQNFEALVHVTVDGIIDSIYEMPVAENNHIVSITRLESNGFALLTKKNSAANSSPAEVVLLDNELRPKAVFPLIADEYSSPRFIHETGPDTFLVSGAAKFNNLKQDDWYFRSFWKLPFQKELLPQADTLVCPGATVSLGIDSLSGMAMQFTWQHSGEPVPATILINGQDSTLQIVAQNAQGCFALAARKVITDKLKTAIDTHGSTCGFSNGAVYLKVLNPVGPVTIAWADGNTALVRPDLPPGMYPVVVSDSVCQQHFSPVIEVSAAPMPVSAEQKGYLLKATPGSFGRLGEIILLTDGTPIFWSGDQHVLKGPDSLLLRNYQFNKVLAFPDTTFAIVATAYTVNESQLLIYNRLEQPIGAYNFPVKYLNDIVPLPGGGYMALGTNATTFGDDAMPVLLKLNPAFQPVWVKSLPVPGRSETGVQMVLLPNGQVAIAAHSTVASSTKDMRLMMIDADGELIWSKLYGGEEEDQWVNLKATPSGSLIAAANTRSLLGDLAGVNSSSSAACWLFRINSVDGAIEWSHIVAGTSPYEDVPGFFPDGTIVYAANTKNAAIDDFAISSEHLTAYDPATGDSIWSVHVLNSVMLYGTPYCVPNGDILWPHAWLDNFVPGPLDGHCCPYADFHLQINKLGNGQIPQPFTLGPDTTLCFGDTLQISAAAANAAITWENNTYDITRNIGAAGIYIARAGSLCPLFDTIRVDYCLSLPFPNSIAGCAPVLVDGGMPGLPHAWSNGHIGEQNAIQQTGWLTLTVTNFQGQTITDSIFVTVYPISTYETAQTNLICYEDMSGEVLVTPSGEGTPYQYLWHTGSTDSLLQGLAAGDYSLTVTDAFGCTFQTQFLVTQPDKWVVTPSYYQITDSTYKLYAYVSGNNIHQPISYLWSNGALTYSTTTAGGFVSVTVTDALGCAKADTFNLPTLTSQTRTLFTDNYLTAFPNPFSTNFLVENTGQAPDFVEARDLSGRSMPVTFSAMADGRLRFFADAWAPGVYTLLLRWEGKVGICRLVKVGQ